MIGIQTKALFVDAYRDLNARKLFWVVLILNIVVVGVFAALGVSNNRLGILTWRLPDDIPNALFLYKWIFSTFIVGYWLTWIAAFLALISTASIFPDFMAGGAIDLYLSKPIGRTRLFITKYVAGLLFVTLQVGVFTVSSFFVLGMRGGVWEPGLFLAIPIVVVFFSYLFSICVLLGVYTRSTLASFFLTLVIWFLIWGVNTADQAFAQIDQTYRERAARSQVRLSRLDSQIAAAERPAGSGPATSSAAASTSEPALNASQTRYLQRLHAQRDEAAATAQNDVPPPWAYTVQRIIFWCDTFIPKTQETIGLLNRALFKDAELSSLEQNADETSVTRQLASAISFQRSLLWVLGSSLAFEVVVLALACRRFCRLDH